jgi:hypothetical protein
VKLSQHLGIEQKTRTRVHREVTELYRRSQQADLFNGFNRVYQPVDDDGDQLPPESKRVQYKVDEMLAELRRLATERMDAVATKEWGNTKAAADVVINGQTILAGVPVGYLLFLEKQLDELHVFIRGLPTLDPSESWELDRGDGLYRSEPATTHKMRKVPRSHVLVPATEHHPAQAETYHEDVIVGEWTRVLRSGAVHQVRVDDLSRRVIQLRDAVIAARQAANAVDVDDKKVGTAIFEYVLG